MNFREKWRAAVQRKNSLLCVGIDPTEVGQQEKPMVAAGQRKLDYCLEVIKAVAPFAAAIKPNRQYVRDMSREEIRTLNDYAHSLGLLSIDDAKVADIGDTNDAAFFHAAQEGYDAVTYAPFPGNMVDSVRRAQRWGVGIIPLVLMSNPEYAAMKEARVAGEPLYAYLAKQAVAAGADGIVVGAPSANNHLRIEEMREVRQLVGADMLVLMPGLGAQGGELTPVYETFGESCMVNVGRAILQADEVAVAARYYRDLIQKVRPS